MRATLAVVFLLSFIVLCALTVVVRTHRLKHCPGRKIVAVVGMGHVRGMQKYWNDQIDIKSLLQVRFTFFYIYRNNCTHINARVCTKTHCAYCASRMLTCVCVFVAEKTRSNLYAVCVFVAEKTRSNLCAFLLRRKQGLICMLFFPPCVLFIGAAHRDVDVVVHEKVPHGQLCGGRVLVRKGVLESNFALSLYLCVILFMTLVTAAR